MNKNLTLRMGNCHHRRYIPMLIELVRSGQIDPLQILTQVEPITDAIAAYQAFDQRKPGWIKVCLKPEEDAKAGTRSHKLDKALEDTFPASDPATHF
ncbi:MAG TPA: hypothetical protein VHE37_05065, partial [Nevskiaceae bacterium]|nr:hypothetical protein [Nevskiaceae bacterium]